MATAHHDAAHHAAAAGHDDHVVGTMDITAQQRTFDGFVKFAVWNVVVIAVVLVFLALANA